MIKVVIYDLDNTLINTTEVLDSVLNHVFDINKSYLDCSQEEFILANKNAILELLSDFKSGKLLLSQLGFLVWYKTLSNLKVDPTPKKIFDLYETLQKLIMQNIKLNPHVLEAIAWLKEKDIKIAVLSNGNFIERIRKLQAVGLLDKVDVLVSSDLVGKDKPSPDTFLYTLKLLDIHPSEAVVVGDSISEDVQPCSKLGILLGILYNPKAIKIPNDIRQIKDHLELKELVEDQHIK